MSIADLADILIRAGVIEGMELDINVDWVQYSTYTGPLNTPINGGNGKSLIPSMPGRRADTSRRTGPATSSPCHCDRTRHIRPRPRPRPQRAANGPSPSAIVARAGALGPRRRSEGSADSRSRAAVGESLQVFFTTSSTSVVKGTFGVPRPSACARRRGEATAADARSLERVGHALAQSIESGLRASVEVEVPTNAHGGDRTDDEYPAAPLGDHPTTGLGERRDGPGEVHVGYLSGERGIVLLLELVAHSPIATTTRSTGPSTLSKHSETARLASRRHSRQRRPCRRRRTVGGRLLGGLVEEGRLRAARTTVWARAAPSLLVTHARYPRSRRARRGSGAVRAFSMCLPSY